ncbi:unnamed protein product [Allacma fusca]|uniref:Uncharacterized protein n=1 Tax=Allacma fusca TaxID=39272 RepID=A0A8J2PDH0_9HEXA|nr:unnamed protein product [Allacma fusca]
MQDRGAIKSNFGIFGCRNYHSGYHSQGGESRVTVSFYRVITGTFSWETTIGTVNCWWTLRKLLVVPPLGSCVSELRFISSGWIAQWNGAESTNDLLLLHKNRGNRIHVLVRYLSENSGSMPKSEKQTQLILRLFFDAPSRSCQFGIFVL